MAYSIPQIDGIFNTYTAGMEKSLEAYRAHLLTLRAGRANPHILDKVSVDYYGNPTPLQQMANITVTEARIIVISLWDMTAIKAAEKAILDANIGITPNSDGKVIRLIFPELTEERRRDLVKEIKGMLETTKVAYRSLRRDTIEQLKKSKSTGVITEDDYKSFEKDVDTLLAFYTDKLEKVYKDKETEILSV